MSILEKARITADDWGISPGVNEGILDLCRRGIVTRVSILATAGHVGYGLGELMSIPGVELGLHYNVTLGMRSLVSFLVDSVTPVRRRKVLGQAARALEDQLTALFRRGIVVKYLDGHQHAHLVPGWLEACAPVLRRHGIDQVRLPLDWRLLRTGRAPVVLLAALVSRSFRRHGLRPMPCWYPLASDFASPEVFLKRLARFEGPVEVIVHPAAYLDFDRYQIADDFREPRVREYQLLARLVT